MTGIYSFIANENTFFCPSVLRYDMVKTLVYYYERV